ncbi:hypothetical protein STEG23_008452, partial [Scotinomys teguina]
MEAVTRQRGEKENVEMTSYARQLIIYVAMLGIEHNFATALQMLYTSVKLPTFCFLYKNKFNCTRRAQCPGTNVSSVQIQGDADYFINHLGVPTVQFAYEDIKALE